MELQLIRSATIKIKYAGKTILVPYALPETVHENAQRHRQLSCHGRRDP
jgi:hypothetical protein